MKKSMVSFISTANSAENDVTSSSSSVLDDKKKTYGPLSKRMCHWRYTPKGAKHDVNIRQGTVTFMSCLISTVLRNTHMVHMVEVSTRKALAARRRWDDEDMATTTTTFLLPPPGNEKWLDDELRRQRRGNGYAEKV